MVERKRTPFIVLRKEKISDLRNIFLPRETPCFIIGDDDRISRLGWARLQMYNAVPEFEQSGIIMIAPVKDGCVVLKGADMIQEFLDRFVFGGEPLTGIE